MKLHFSVKSQIPSAVDAPTDVDTQTFVTDLLRRLKLNNPKPFSTLWVLRKMIFMTAWTYNKAAYETDSIDFYCIRELLNGLIEQVELIQQTGSPFRTADKVELQYKL